MLCKSSGGFIKTTKQTKQTKAYKQIRNRHTRKQLDVEFHLSSGESTFRTSNWLVVHHKFFAWNAIVGNFQQGSVLEGLTPIAQQMQFSKDGNHSNLKNYFKKIMQMKVWDRQNDLKGWNERKKPSQFIAAINAVKVRFQIFFVMDVKVVPTSCFFVLDVFKRFFLLRQPLF